MYAMCSLIQGIKFADRYDWIFLGAVKLFVCMTLRPPTYELQQEIKTAILNYSTSLKSTAVAP